MATLKATTITDTGFILLPQGTSAQRPASPSDGMIRYNTQLGYTEWYDSELDNWFPTGYTPIVATGGTTADRTVGGVSYRIHSFTSVGLTNFVVTRSGSIDYAIVAGGGGGGSFGGGGGAGGVLVGSTTLRPGTYPVMVGAGGAGEQDYAGNNPGPPGFNGGDSSAFGLTAIGGGGGGTRDTSATGYLGQPGEPGGSGGGGAHGNTGNIVNGDSAPGAATIGQGFPGGRGRTTTAGDQPDHAGGGGGGAGQQGFDAVGDDDYGFSNVGYGGGRGGHGVYLGHIFSDSYGDSGWFAGGGGGVTYTGGLVALGGRGGGGNGGRTSPDVAGQNGTNNTGGGGGAGYTTDNSTGNGGSGVVLIRYRIS